MGNNQSIDLIDPTIQLNEDLHRPDERPVLSYHLDPGRRAAAQHRVDRDDADGWRLQQMDLLPGTPEAPSLSGTQTPVTLQIAIGDFQSNYLPAPYLPLSWDVDGSWSYDPRTLTVLNVDRRRNNQAVAGLSYSVDSLLAQPDADELANATADSIDDTGLDDDVPSRDPSTSPIRSPTARKATARRHWRCRTG